jgi:hypothetical protein
MNSIPTYFENEFEYIKSNFCGIVFDFKSKEYKQWLQDNKDPRVYVCGNFKEYENETKELPKRAVYIISELSTNFSVLDKQSLSSRVETPFPRHYFVSLGQVPINVYNVGVYFRNYFDENSRTFFDMINERHEFQTLTESIKIGNAYRTGIYMSNVTEKDDESRFHLLRCSTNLNGPTDNFRGFNCSGFKY